MASEAEIREKFWDAIESDRTVMLALTGVDDGHARPMTAQVGDAGDLWFFTARDNDIAKRIKGQAKSFFTFASKGHDTFATVHGTIEDATSPANVEAHWNRFVAAWYEGGKEDPNLVLLRFRPAEAQIWIDASSFVAGIKMLLGMDPKKDYRDKVAQVRL